MAEAKLIITNDLLGEENMVNTIEVDGEPTVGQMMSMIEALNTYLFQGMEKKLLEKCEGNQVLADALFLQFINHIIEGRNKQAGRVQ